MADHYLPDSYTTDESGHVWVRCVCGWESTRVWPDRDVHGLLSEACQARLWGLWEDHVRPLAEPPSDQTLIRGERGRDYLDGEPLSCGTPIEVQFPGGVWVRGRYEVERGVTGPVPVFYAQLGGPASDNGVLDRIPHVHFCLPATAVVRRPQTTEVRRAS